MAKEKKEKTEKPAESKEEKVKHMGPFTPTSFRLEPVYDPEKVKKYKGKRPEATIPHTWLLKAMGPKETVEIVIDKTNVNTLRVSLGAVFPAI